MRTAIKTNVKDKKKVLDYLTKDPKVTNVPLLHEDLHKEIIELCKQVMDKSTEVFGLAQSMVDSEGKISLQNSASLANLLSPFLRVSHLVQSSNMEVMYKELEKILLANGAEKNNVQ